MLSKSSASAGGICSDGEKPLAALATLARKAMDRHPHLQRVILFGSLARGDDGLYSDADLLLVLSSSALPRYFDRIPDFIDDFVRAPVPVDIFPYTEDELRRMIKDDNPFIKRILAEGQVVAERG